MVKVSQDSRHEKQAYKMLQSCQRINFFNKQDHSTENHIYLFFSSCDVCVRKEISLQEKAGYQYYSDMYLLSDNITERKLTKVIAKGR